MLLDKLLWRKYNTFMEGRFAMGIVYEIMHKDRRVARIDTNGRCRIFFSSFMPYNLYLKEDTDFDTERCLKQD